VRVLLDTHVVLWWLFDAPELSARARAVIADRANTVLVSAASAWDTATKHRLGRLPEAAEAVIALPDLIVAAGFEPLPISPHHALAAGGLAIAHRDPFDRMLIAQATLEQLVLVSRDEAITAHYAHCLW